MGNASSDDAVHFDVEVVGVGGAGYKWLPPSLGELDRYSIAPPGP